MLIQTLTAIQASEIAVLLRTTSWLMSVVSIAHVVGVALLFGAIVPLDLRLLGFWRSITIGDLSKALVPVAVIGLVLAMTTGGLMFTVAAVKLGASTLFRVKLGLILAGVLNALALRMARVWVTRRETAFVRGEPRLKAAGGISLTVWLAAVIIGRSLGLV